MLPKLRDTLKRSCEKYRGSDDGHPLGWCAKRLDIAMRDMIDVSVCSGQLELECLSEIIRCLPNLIILAVSVTAHPFQLITFPTSLLCDLVKSSGTTLQAIVWQDICYFSLPSDWYTTLMGCSRLKTIACATPFEETLDLNFPLLKTLHVLGPRSTGLCEIPSLRRLISNASVSRITSGSLGASLRESHVAKLETIQLKICSYYILLPSWLDSISALCPNLSRLDLSFLAWPHMNRFNARLSLPESLRILGIQSLKDRKSTRLNSSHH